MTIVNLAGAETGSLADGVQVSGTGWAASTVQKHTGAYAYRCNHGAAATSIIEWRQDGADGNRTNLPATVYVSCYVYFTTLPGSNNFRLGLYASSGGAAPTLQVLVNSSGEVTLNANTTSAVVATLSTGQWYRFDIRGSNSGTAGLSIDGGAETTVTCLPQSPNYFGAWANNAAMDVYLDDIILSDSSFPSGDYGIEVMVPNADGSAYTSWTASAGNKWDCVEEIPANTADYITSSGDGTRYSAALESSSSAGISGSILAVKAMGAFGESVSGVGLAAIGVHSSGTDSETTGYDIPVGTSPWIGKTLETDPDTSAAWTTSGLDSLEVIAKEVSGNAVRCFIMHVHVAFSSAVTGSGTPVLPFPIMVATGAQEQAGTGSLVTPFPVMVASGTQIEEGTSALVTPFPIMVASGTLADFYATSSLILPFPIIQATGEQVFLGSGNLVLPFPVMVAVGAYPMIGSGSLILPFPVLTASGSLVFPPLVVSETILELTQYASLVTLPEYTFDLGIPEYEASIRMPTMEEIRHILTESFTREL